MSLNYVNTPAHINEFIKSNLKIKMAIKAIIDSDDRGGFSKIESQPINIKTTEINITYPFPLYFCKLEDIEKDKLPVAFVGWRALLFSSFNSNSDFDSIIGTLDVSFNKKTNKLILSGIRQGGYVVSNLAKLFHAATDIDNNNKIEYEMNFLIIPAIQIETLWLSDKNKNNDESNNDIYIYISNKEKSNVTVSNFNSFLDYSNNKKHKTHISEQ